MLHCSCSSAPPVSFTATATWCRSQFYINRPLAKFTVNFYSCICSWCVSVCWLYKNCAHFQHEVYFINETVDKSMCVYVHIYIHTVCVYTYIVYAYCICRYSKREHRVQWSRIRIPINSLVEGVQHNAHNVLIMHQKQRLCAFELLLCQCV